MPKVALGGSNQNLNNSHWVRKVALHRLFQGLRSTSNVLVLCLSTADLLVSAVNMPVAVYTLAIGNWPFSHEACLGLGYITMVTFVASVMSLCTISLCR